MKTRYHVFASILALVALPLMADTAPSAGEEVALELQEIAGSANRPAASIVAKKNDDCGRRSMRDNRKDTMVMPEEQAIGMQKNVITPSVYPYVSTGTNTFVSADFIWWKAVLAGTGYAYNGTADGYHVPLGTSVGGGTLKRPDFGFQPGCKIGIGTHFDHDGWDIAAEYTYLSGPEEENHISAGSDNGAKSFINVTTGDGVFAPVNIDYASSEWDQNFNVVDLALGRNFFISKYLTLRPHAGLKTAWIHHHAEYSFIPTPNTYDPRSGVVNQVWEAFTNRQQHMWGLGLRGGIDTMWHVTKNWAFYGDLAITTMWSDFHVKVSNYVSESIAGVYRTGRVRYSVQTVTPVIESGLGLAFIHWFYDDAYRFQLQAGWEHQVWMDFNYIQTHQGDGSLTTQGLTVKAGLTF